MTTKPYLIKISKNKDPIDIYWNEVQGYCNFVLFQPNKLPEGLSLASNKIRVESEKQRASHKSEFSDENRALSIKQFLYDWAPPAYDHPCLWRNAEISSLENTPIPRPYLIGNNYLWFGLDYRRKPSATINILRTQIEITTLKGEFSDQEIIEIVKSMVPVDDQTKELLLKTSFAELMFDVRYQLPVIEVPTSYFKHTRNATFRCYPRAATPSLVADPSLFPGHWLMNAEIKDYRLNSMFLFGADFKHIQEAEYLFESLIEPGSYIRFLVTANNSKHSIQYPPQLDDQVCHSEVYSLRNTEPLYHAWSRTNENGSHSLVLKIKDEIINCIVKPAPWTNIKWVRELCQNIIMQSDR